MKTRPPYSRQVKSIQFIQRDKSQKFLLIQWLVITTLELLELECQRLTSF